MRQIIVRPFLLGLIICVSFCAVGKSRGANFVVTATPENVRYVGVAGCQSSYCHGGASPTRGQCAIWSQKDFHSRAYATLVTPRATRMAESLKIESAAESSRCTSCHAPFQTIPPAQLAPTVRVSEGVSCETCHNGAEAWLRGHTRPDWTYANRVEAGMRDLRDADVRAQTCVACHQVLAPDLREAGHPELIFELDGQTASEPRHWKEKPGWSGAKAWLVGQAVALQEMSARQESQPRQDLEALLHGNDFAVVHLSPEEQFDPALWADQQALFWVLKEGMRPEKIIPGWGDLGTMIGSLRKIGGDDNPRSAFSARNWSSNLAREVSGLDWKPAMTAQALQSLAATSDAFLDPQVSHLEQALRAERLVLGLDRLFKALAPAAPGQMELKALFAAVQDRENFNAPTFAQKLRQFAAVVEPKQ